MTTPRASPSIPIDAQPSPRTIVVTYVDRVYYHTFEELEAASDAIVVGRLLSTSRETGRSDDGAIVHLAQDFRVERSLKGGAAAGAVLPVATSVDAATGAPISFDGEDALATESRYVLFLERGPDAYSTAGGPQGAYAVVDGTLRATTDEDLRVIGTLVGKTVNDLIRLLE